MNNILYTINFNNGTAILVKNISREWSTAKKIIINDKEYSLPLKDEFVKIENVNSAKIIKESHETVSYITDNDKLKSPISVEVYDKLSAHFAAEYKPDNQAKIDVLPLTIIPVRTINENYSEEKFLSHKDDDNAPQLVYDFRYGFSPAISFYLPHVFNKSDKIERMINDRYPNQEVVANNFYNKLSVTVYEHPYNGETKKVERVKANGHSYAKPRFYEVKKMPEKKYEYEFTDKFEIKGLTYEDTVNRVYAFIEKMKSGQR